ncbi:MFS transporter [Dactylosporangium sp. NPDC005572]|uniref:MFS transporter n=1 Tax=Dactylosporangium sp. NPDC005572 TaxID=3156889 RepID=UPI00339E8F80
MEERRLLRDPGFRIWYLSRAVSYAGAMAATVALPLLAYQLTESARVTATVAALESLPYLLIGLFAGAAADRMRRRAMMIGADLWCALATATVPVAHAAGVLTVPHVLAVAFAVGLGFCWFDAAAWGALARIAGRDRLARASSLIISAQTVLQITIPAAAGLLATLTHPAVVLAANAATYLVSAALLTALRGDLDPASGQPTSIREGIRYLWRQPTIRTLSLTGFLLSASTGGAVGLLVVHAHEGLGLRVPDSRLGLLYTAGAVGALLAAALFPALRRRLGPGPVSILGYALFTATLSAFALTGAFVPALLIWLVWQLAVTVATTNGILVRQELTPDELQGRVNTTGRMMAWGGTPFGAFLAGALAETWGTRAALLAMVLPVAVGLLALLCSPIRTLRTLPAEMVATPAQARR